MNSDKFIKLIANPNAVSEQETLALSELLKEFPYFQTARVLHLKGLKNQHSFTYNKELKITAAYTTNRTVLFDFITKNSLDFETETLNEEDLINDIDVIDSTVVNHLYKSINASQDNKDIFNELKQFDKLDTLPKKESKKEINKPLEKEDNEVEKSIKNLLAKVENDNKLKENKVEKEIINIEEEIVNSQQKETVKSKEEDILNIGKPINFTKDDTFSFSEWLQLDTKEPISRVSLTDNSIKNKEEKAKTDTNKKSDLDLIDQFIASRPKIKPIKNQKVSDISLDSSTENSSLMTETLAKVYLEQKKYKKAIAAFKILSLKYPEKSSFFADQIKAIVFLENNKS